MSAYVLHDEQGNAKSIASAAPVTVPAGLSQASVTDAQYAGLRSGESRWDPPTRTVVVDTARAQARAEQDATTTRVEAVKAKARAILADPQGSPDWTAAERKLVLAVLVLRSIG